MKKVKNDEWSLDEEEKPKSLLEDKIEKELLDKGVILLHGELNEKLCNFACKKLLYLEAKGFKSIRIVLNSPGGEVYHALLVYNTIKELVDKGLKVEVEARGLVASAAMLILQAGSLRRASKYSRFLIHEVSSWSYGKASEIVDESKEVMKVNEMLLEILAEKSSLTKRRLAKMIKRKDFWFGSEEAKKWGFIDEVI